MPPASDHAFEDLVRYASGEGWCTRLGCTTCGAHDFRRALNMLDGGAVGALSGADLGSLTCTASWRDCVLIALWDVGPEGRNRVLQAWLPRVGSHVRLADVVLFYVVRKMPLDRVSTPTENVRIVPVENVRFGGEVAGLRLAPVLGVVRYERVTGSPLCGRRQRGSRGHGAGASGSCCRGSRRCGSGAARGRSARRP